MDKGLISVIVPVYNAEKFLDRCISSVVNQTYKNLEIILINDGSKDNSLQICKNWQKKDSRIIVIDKPNGGVSDSRNRGIDVCSGDYIAFVDADDYIDRKMYEKLLKSININSSDVAFCNYIYTFENGNESLEYIETNLHCISGKNIFNYFTKNDSYVKGNKVYCGGISGFIWRGLYKTKFIGSNRFKSHKYFEDLLFLVELINDETKISSVDECLYYYFQNSKSVMHCNISKEDFEMKLSTYMTIVKELEKKLKNKDDVRSYKFYIYKALMINAINSDLISNKEFKTYLKSNNVLKNLNSWRNYKDYNKNKSIKNRISNFLIHNNLFKIYKLIAR